MLTPGEILILKALKRRISMETEKKMKGIYVGDKYLLSGLSFSQLKENTGLSSSVLSKYLKNLQKIDLVRRDIDTRRYNLTKDNGEVALKLLTIIENLDGVLSSKNAKPLSSYRSSIDKISKEVSRIIADIL